MIKPAVPAQFDLSFAARCDRGLVREENQDSVLRAATPLGDLLIVADGLGGYQGGAVASRLAVDTIAGYFAGLPAGYLPAKAIRESIVQANAEIVAAAAAPGTPYSHMGSTVVMALLRPVSLDEEPGAIPPDAVLKAWIGHVGDSRAYHVRDRRLYRITRDHSAVQTMLDRNLITPEQARNHPDSSVLTRSLGHEAEVDADIDSVLLVPGDSLLLCSDGLWGYVAEEAIEAVAANPALDLETASAALLELALTAGGPDNVGIEMAHVAPVAGKKISSTSAASFQRTHSFRRRRFTGILAIVLLAFAGIGAFAYFAYLKQWIHLPGRNPQIAPAPLQNAPAAPQATPAAPPGGPAAAHGTPAPARHAAAAKPQGGAVAPPAGGPALLPTAKSEAKPQTGPAPTSQTNPAAAPQGGASIKPPAAPAVTPPAGPPPTPAQHTEPPGNPTPTPAPRSEPPAKPQENPPKPQENPAAPPAAPKN